ncbi:hypothetical protein QN277_000908 [Acacia crassicarpa]|uniref:Uncharacterized protein n=1 Tax=Acacia crassicarpa TaxID=499986 RepID=A0AAE1N607_9FABA|nr:hypothetical protein QN277_000908 [Acacia crassicarpa]
MPTYVKFLKDTIFPRKKQLGLEIIPLTPIASKSCQPGRRLNEQNTKPLEIPCVIIHHITVKAICDPGSQVNIMPRSVAQQLTISNEQTAEISFQLVDRTMIHPTSERHNVLMQVGIVTLPVDFIIHDRGTNYSRMTPIVLR